MFTPPVRLHVSCFCDAERKQLSANIELSIRPCKHQFCNVCIRKLESVIADVGHGRKHWKCPRCDSDVRYVAGFSAPMNLPGEETLKANVPVTVLKASSNGRPVFQSIYTTRI